MALSFSLFLSFKEWTTIKFTRRKLVRLAPGKKKLTRRKITRRKNSGVCRRWQIPRGNYFSPSTPTFIVTQIIAVQRQAPVRLQWLDAVNTDNGSAAKWAVIPHFDVHGWSVEFLFRKILRCRRKGYWKKTISELCKVSISVSIPSCRWFYRRLCREAKTKHESLLLG